VVWTAAFRGPRSQFWLRMTLGVGGLGAYALAVEPSLRHERPRLRDVFKGLGSAAGLYAIFQVGDRMARRIMPAGDREIAAIYQLRTAAPPEARLLAGLEEALPQAGQLSQVVEAMRKKAAAANRPDVEAFSRVPSDLQALLVGRER